MAGKMISRSSLSKFDSKAEVDQKKNGKIEFMEHDCLIFESYCGLEWQKLVPQKKIN